MTDFKQQFPIFIKNPDLVYLDSAATALTPQIVIDKMNEYYTDYGANIHRGLYDLSERATSEYEAARKKVADFINAEPFEIVFTSGTTQSLNMLAESLTKNLKPGDNIVLTELEHHANFVPWQEVAKKVGVELRCIPLNTANWKLEIKNYIDENTKVVSVAHISNVLGIRLPVEDIIARAKEVGAITILDAAQSVAHENIDVKKLDVDFLAFSGHKLYGPTGIGVLYGKKERLDTLDPVMYGGDMIEDVSFQSASWAPVPQRFEAGTPNIAGAIGLGAVIDFIKEVGFKTISEHESTLTKYLIAQLSTLPEVTIIGPGVEDQHAGIVSFTLDGIHPHDIAEICNRHNVAIRAGHHCAMPLMKKLGIPGTARVSIGVYNSEKDVHMLMTALKAAIKLFKNP